MVTVVPISFNAEEAVKVAESALTESLIFLTCWAIKIPHSLVAHIKMCSSPY